MKIVTTSKFRRAYKKLPPALKNKAGQKEKIFRENPFDRQLDTHKLKGKYSRYWSFSITGSYRIMFDFMKDDEVAFINVGNHNIYN